MGSGLIPVSGIERKSPVYEVLSGVMNLSQDLSLSFCTLGGSDESADAQRKFDSTVGAV